MLPVDTETVRDNSRSRPDATTAAAANTSSAPKPIAASRTIVARTAANRMWILNVQTT